jgi:hypothetical protein
VETSPDLEQRPDPAKDVSLSSGWFRNATQQFQESRFTGAISANDAQHFAGRDVEIDILECPEPRVVVAVV